MNTKPTLWYAVLIVMALLIALAGYAGYALYPRFDLPSVSGASLLLLAAGAGIASFFTPCSFPLLTTLLARAIDTNKIRHPIGQSLRYGTALAAGASVFLLLTGAGIALGGGALFEQVTFTSSAGRILRFMLGSLLVLFGSVQVGWFSLPFGKVTSLVIPIRKFQITIRDKHPTPGFFIFGFAYILAGFGWTGPILAGLAGHALTIGGETASLLAFIVAAITMTILFFGLAVGIAIAQEQVVSTLRAHTAQVKRWGGYILMTVGVWLLMLAIFADFFARIFPV